MQDKAGLSTSFWSSQLSTEDCITYSRNMTKVPLGVSKSPLMYIFCVSGMTYPFKVWSEVYNKVLFIPKGTSLSIYTCSFDYCP